MNRRTITIRNRSTDTPHPMMEEINAFSSPPPSGTTSQKADAGEDNNDRDPANPNPPKPLPPKPRPSGTAQSDIDPTTTNPPPSPRPAYAKPAISALAASTVLAAINTTPRAKRKAEELLQSPPWQFSGNDDGGVQRSEEVGKSDEPPPGDPNPLPPGDPNPPPAGPPPSEPEIGEEGPGCPGPPPTKPLPPDPPR